ncbi:glutamate 5-kinase [Angomonas deanei]|uniref:Amino acid kinase family, putative n=1 Tax=Angomonas deanei TaxID=59799 RepID=A0A7G2C9D3_9TRYP|nr:glutamate 5-kinase [Angomonas deanei]CAD2216460.1 Amino acid kinase family, putative [Angomonas deanei]|eukprot:EPY43758.1 glutamate 5-kinase [Angomonas deanei]
MTRPRIVVKIGSQIVVRNNKLDIEHIDELCSLIAELFEKYEVIVVISGAVAAGLTRLQLDRKPVDNRQALSTIGQPLLMHLYSTALRKRGLTCTQLLLTVDDFDSRKRCKNASDMVDVLLAQKLVPLINENDLTTVGELVFGDNNKMSAYVTHYFRCALLVILSQVDGYYDSDPKVNRDAKLRKVVHHVEPQELTLAVKPDGIYAARGIVTKLEAAKFLLERKEKMFLCNGHDLTAVKEFLLGGNHASGTLFQPEGEASPIFPTV